MRFEYNNEFYNIIIEKKKIKNMYLRVKEDLNIYISCNIFTTNKQIQKMINENYDSICKMIEKQKNRVKKNKDFYYIGNKYNIFYTNNDRIDIKNNEIYIKNETELNKWYKKQIIATFTERLNICILKFEESLPKINLKIRNMKTRWGVCNRSNNNVTLNTNLIKYKTDIIDYVIFHELSHFIHPNHSKRFWNLVSKYVPNYKDLRKELNK